MFKWLVVIFNFLSFRHDQTCHFCITPGAESKVWNIHMYFSLPINPHLPTEHLAIFLFSYLACVAATALSMIFTAAINGRLHRDILYHFCDHQLTPVHFWDIITSALWIKASEQLVRESCNKQTRWDTQEIRLHLWGIPHLIQIPSENRVIFIAPGHVSSWETREHYFKT